MRKSSTHLCYFVNSHKKCVYYQNIQLEEEKKQVKNLNLKSLFFFFCSWMMKSAKYFSTWWSCCAKEIIQFSTHLSSLTKKRDQIFVFFYFIFFLILRYVTKPFAISSASIATNKLSRSASVKTVDLIPFNTSKNKNFVRWDVNFSNNYGNGVREMKIHCMQHIHIKFQSQTFNRYEFAI